MHEGVVLVPCVHGAAETADRLEQVLRARRIEVFARIDHAAGAAAVGLELPPTIVVIFGDPRAGTPLMQAAQPIGLELPLKILCFSDASGAHQLAYPDLPSLAARYGLGDHPTVAKMAQLLAALAAAVAS
jgi:uncharacterized protein (DUF302 family)